MVKEPSFEDFKRAHRRIAPFVHHTPVFTCDTINRMVGGELFFKAENLQKIGAFKARGAMNAVLTLLEEGPVDCVATHSSGNHAQALAFAAKQNNIAAHIVMPSTAPGVKKAAVLGYGARVVECEPTLQARESTLTQVVNETGSKIVHPYNDYLVIAGQGTASMELVEDVPDLEQMITPVGGGGLLAGTLLAMHYTNPSIAVYAGEPVGADDAAKSLAAGKVIPSQSPNTIADGLLTSLGDKTWPIIQRHVEGILTVTDDEIKFAMQLMWERMKLIVEPSSAVVLASVLKNKDLFANKKTGLIITGGNVDLRKYFG